MIYAQTTIANAQHYSDTFTNQYDTQQTDLAIITPGSGESLSVKGVYVSTEATSGLIRFKLGTNTVFTLFANAQPGYVPLNVSGGVDEALTMTSALGADKDYFVAVNYRSDI